MMYGVLSSCQYRFPLVGMHVLVKLGRSLRGGVVQGDLFSRQFCFVLFVEGIMYVLVFLGVCRTTQIPNTAYGRYREKSSTIPYISFPKNRFRGNAVEFQKID